MMIIEVAARYDAETRARTRATADKRKDIWHFPTLYSSIFARAEHALRDAQEPCHFSPAKRDITITSPLVDTAAGR